ncbi:MAG: hypothetical protein ACK4NW_02050 [Roseinatronobacter sp.]
MQILASNSIKVNRAVAMSQIGSHPASAQAMLAAIPRDVIDALPSRLVAALLDANWQLAQQSKAIAEADAVQEGAIWDARRGQLREIAQ